MITKFKEYIHNLSIKYKLFAIFLIVISVPFCIFLSVNFILLSQEAKNQAQYTANKVLSQTKEYLDFKTYSIRVALSSISYNETIKEIMNKSVDDYNKDVGLWGFDSNRLKKALFTSYENKDISSVYFYMKQGPASIQQTEEYISLSSVNDTDWYKRLVQSNYVINWFPNNYFKQTSGKNNIYASKSVYNDVNEFLGIVTAEIPESTFRSLLDNAPFIKNTSVILINNSNEILSTSSNSLIKDNKIIRGILSDPLAKNLNNSNWTTIIYSNTKNLLGVTFIANTDWRLIFVIPYDSLLQSTTNANRRLTLIFLIIAPLTLPLAFFVASSSTNRIRKLIINMRNVVNGDFTVSILPSYNDEIGELTKNFNYMLTRMSMLIDDKFELGKEVKNKELKALQAQINPHFLYNTLDLIKWMSVRVQAPEIGRAVETLSMFYKLSLSKGEDIVTLRDELYHVSTYVQIQNMRFSDSIKLIIDVPEELYKYRIIKIILQPIVENSILHGIMEKDRKSVV